MLKRFGNKQPSEQFYVTFDFAAYLAGGETISTVTVTAIDLDGNSVATDTLTDATKQMASDSAVYVWLRSGADGHDHEITVKVTTTAGAVYELDGAMMIQDR